MLSMKFRIIVLTEPMFPIWKLSIINCLCILSTELTSIFGIGFLFDTYTILISSPVHLAKHGSILIFVVFRPWGLAIGVEFGWVIYRTTLTFSLDQYHV